jgi:hypothetical protein
LHSYSPELSVAAAGDDQSIFRKLSYSNNYSPHRSVELPIAQQSLTQITIHPEALTKEVPRCLRPQQNQSRCIPKPNTQVGATIMERRPPEVAIRIKYPDKSKLTLPRQRRGIGPEGIEISNIHQKGAKQKRPLAEEWPFRL